MGRAVLVGLLLLKFILSLCTIPSRITLELNSSTPEEVFSPSTPLLLGLATAEVGADDAFPRREYESLADFSLCSALEAV